MHPSTDQLVQHVRDYEEDEANALWDAIAREVAGDRVRTISTFRPIADGMCKTYEYGWAARALRLMLEAAWAGPAEAANAIAIELAWAYDEHIDDEALTAFDGELSQRLASEPARELTIRLAIGVRLEHSRRHAFVLANLRAAEALATTDIHRLEITTQRARQLREMKRSELASANRHTLAADEHACVDLSSVADHARNIERCVVLANQLAGNEDARDSVIRADLEIAWNDPVLAHRHTARAEELARSSTDPALRITATTALAELLLEAELLERADAVASTLPLEKGELPALLEDIRRRRGLLAEPPPEAFVAPPVAKEAENIFGFFGTGALPEGFAAYFTRGEDSATAITRVESPENIRVWSYGAVTTPADLESQKIFGPMRSFACACSRFLGAKYLGVVCHRCGVELVDRVTRTVRPGHVVLRERVLHPWHASTIAMLLGMGVREVQRANVDELYEQLRELDYNLLTETERLRDQRPNDPRIVVMDAVLQSSIKPEWFVLEIVPVWPPETPLLHDPSAVARAYVEILDGVDVRTAVSRMFSLVARQLAR